jgi:hypothetical protein
MQKFNYYANSSRPLNVCNPSMVDESFLDCALLGPSFGDGSKQLRSQLSYTLTMQPPISPKKGMRAITDFRDNSHHKESFRLLRDMNWEMSPGTVWLCFFAAITISFLKASQVFLSLKSLVHRAQLADILLPMLPDSVPPLLPCDHARENPTEFCQLL